MKRGVHTIKSVPSITKDKPINDENNKREFHNLIPQTKRDFTKKEFLVSENFNPRPVIL